ncbi:MAG: hypothetical protein JXX28_03990 [Deltaproteobacteria bacterium]|nr:hypothetical protein [Deltaproteobacteria bacterium]
MIALLLATGALAGMHPPVTLLGADWLPVVETGAPVSTAATCGQCHDAAWIAGHSYHSAMDFDRQVEAGTAPSGRPWDLGTGPGTRWSPLLDEVVPGMDAATLQERLGPYLVGGGSISPDMEMNCFLCHTPSPDNAARVEDIQGGHPEWALTATLQGLGLVHHTPPDQVGVEVTGEGEGTLTTGIWSYNLDRFSPEGAVDLQLGQPTSENCGVCHGTVHSGNDALLLDFGGRGTRSAGRVFSPQRIASSSLNVAGKEALGRAWDVHAERMLECTDCHYSLNHPAYYQESDDTRPAYLRFDGRKLALSDYLYRPSHDFAKGYSAQGHLAEGRDGSMRACADCHDASATHEWLPYADQHFAALACESCHIPEVYSPALSSVDLSLVTAAGEPVVHWRGVEGIPTDPASLVTGWRPVLLPRVDRPGARPKLTPHNLITSVSWIAGEPAKPIDSLALSEALLQGQGYHPDVLKALDADGSGSLSEGELVLDTEAKVSAVQARLTAAGFVNPTLHTEVEAFGIHHGVTGSGYATKECTTCHAEDGRTGVGFLLAAALPPGMTPALVGDSNVLLDGEVTRTDDGAVIYQSNLFRSGFYLFGQDRLSLLDIFGLLTVVGSVFGLAGHGGLRYLGALKRRKRS